MNHDERRVSKGTFGAARVRHYSENRRDELVALTYVNRARARSGTENRPFDRRDT